MDNDTPTLITFRLGYQEVGTGPDGLPLYTEVVEVTKARPPLLQLTSVATEEDFADHPHAYALFERENKGRRLDGKTGYPLALWAVPSAGDLKMCLDREIYTVEDLAKLATKPSDKIPPSIVELAQRAKRMIELSKDGGKPEARVTELEGQVGALREENQELKRTIEGQNLTIGKLMTQRVA
jgi:hypothetical protein